MSPTLRGWRSTRRRSRSSPGRSGDSGYVDQLRQVDTSGVKPTSHALALTNAFREDAETRHLGLESSLANAPEQEDGSFVVPKVI